MKYLKSITFADHSRVRTQQLKRIDEAKNNLSKKIICKNHPSSPWTQDQFGNWYSQCYYGHSTGTACELLKEENGIASDIACECGEYGIKGEK